MIESKGWWPNPPRGLPGFDPSLPPIVAALTCRAAEFATHLRGAIEFAKEGVPVHVHGMDLEGFPEMLERILDRGVRCVA